LPTPPPVPQPVPTPVPTVEELVAQLRSEFQTRYGLDASDITVQDGGDAGPRIRGTVVTRKQRERLEVALREAGLDVALEVEVLEALPADDPRLPLRLRFPAGRQAVPMHRGAHDDRLVSEWLPIDGVARVIVDAEPRTLIQLRDGTLGWVASGEVPEPYTATEPAQGASVPFVTALARGERIAITHGALDELLGEAEELADGGEPYRLGGRNTDTGVDCSALIQVLIWQATRRWLPRHSADQRRCGERVALDAVAAGDLLFVRAREQGWSHVGLLVDADRVVHACRLDGEVRVESVRSFLARYQFSAARRVLRVGPVPRAAG
jgi:hypothetical protein